MSMYSSACPCRWVGVASHGLLQRQGGPRERTHQEYMCTGHQRAKGWIKQWEGTRGDARAESRPTPPRVPHRRADLRAGGAHAHPGRSRSLFRYVFNDVEQCLTTALFTARADGRSESLPPLDFCKACLRQVTDASSDLRDPNPN